MLTASTALADKLKLVGTKKDWSETIKTELALNRRLRIWRDSNVGATDPATSGVEVLNAGLSGDMLVLAGEIRGVGTANSVLTQVAADFMTGKSFLRIESNGQWIGGTVGPSKAVQMANGVLEANVVDYDFKLNFANLTTTMGIGFTAGFTIKPPRLLPSGTGPVAPTIASTTPTIIELVDWTNPASPSVVGTATFSVRADDWVFSQADIAAEIGDVAVYELDNTIKWTSAKFELGGLMFLANGYNTIDGVGQLEQQLLGFKPLGTWTTYPAMDTFKRALWSQTDTDANGNPIFTCSNAAEADNTYPPPFKVNIYTTAGYKNGAADRTPLYIHEMKAFNGKPTLPINSQEFSQVWTETEPVIPHFNCGQLLPWENKKTRLSSRYRKFIPGVGPRSYAARVARDGFTSNASNAYDDAYTQKNSLNHFYGMPPYPMRKDNDYGDLDDDVKAYDPGPRDPYLFNKPIYNNSLFKPVRMTGWKWQYASITGHDMYTGKGGQRFDRSAAPSVLAIYASNQNYIRPDGNVPIRDLLDGFSFGYFNHSCHFLMDAKSGTSIPKSAMQAGTWFLANGFYGGYTTPPTLPSDAATRVDACGIKAGDSRKALHNDASGRMPWGGYLRDGLHSYSFPAWMTIALNSPMHAYANIFHYNMHWMCNLGSAKPDADPTSFFLAREMAWRWLAYVMQWTVGTQNSKGISQNDVENRFQIELERIYDLMYVPAIVQNSNAVWATAVRNLGVHVVVPNGATSIGSFGGSMGLYNAQILATMKQVGLWSKMKAKSEKCRLALEFVLQCYDKQSIDYILDTKGRDAYYQVLSGVKASGYVFTSADVPANWAAQSTMLDTEYPVLPPDTSNSTANTKSTAERMQNFNTLWNNNKGDGGSTQHLIYQWVTVRKHYFPEYAHARLDEAIAKFETYYAENATYADSGLGQEWAYRLPSHGDLLAPSVVGPN